MHIDLRYRCAKYRHGFGLFRKTEKYSEHGMHSNQILNHASKQTNTKTQSCSLHWCVLAMRVLQNVSASFFLFFKKKEKHKNQTYK